MKKYVIAGLIMAAGFAHATIIYKDTFNDGSFATNPDIGGGYYESAGNGALSETGGSLHRDGDADARGRTIYTLNTFDFNQAQAAGGFRMTVVFRQLGLEDYTGFGLNDKTLNSSGDRWYREADGPAGIGLNAWMGDAANRAGALFHQPGTIAPNREANPSEDLSLASQIKTDGSVNTFLLEVTTADNSRDYTFSINGVESTDHQLHTAFDWNTDYGFAFQSQSAGDFWLDEVVIETIPEPATLGLIAMAGAGVIAVRRFFIM